MGRREAELIDRQPPLALERRKAAGRDAETGVGGHADHRVGIGGEITHLRAEPGRVAEADLIAAYHLEFLVAWRRGPEQRRHLSPELVAAVAKRHEEQEFPIARFRPHLHLDLSRHARHAKRGVAEIHLHGLARYEHSVSLRWPKLDLTGLDELPHFGVNLSLENERVGMFWFLAEHRSDLVEGFLEVLLFHEHLGPSQANPLPEGWVADGRELVQLGQGG